MRIVLKIGIWALTGIIALCIVAVSLLYAPPVQDWLRRQLALIRISRRFECFFRGPTRAYAVA